jgi:hypothetical protein
MSGPFIFKHSPALDTAMENAIIYIRYVAFEYGKRFIP